MRQPSDQPATSPLKSAMEAIGSIGMMVEYPLRMMSDTLMSTGSGASTPRMTISRESSLSSIPIEEKLEAIRRMEEEESSSSFSSVLPFLSSSAPKKPKRVVKIPSDIIWMILSHVAKNCKKVGNNADLLRCALVDKRFNQYSCVFLWHHVDLKSKSGFSSLINLMANPAKRSRFGKLVKGISISQIPFIEKAHWELLLSSCPATEFIGVERCHIHNEIIESEQSTKVTPAPIVLGKLQVLVISDCPTCPMEPINLVCKSSPNLLKLSVSGCNFDETQICEMISHCGNLRDIKLGSHAGSSLTAVGNAGGDEFARTLSEKCPLLIGADLTGIISMTDVGWTTLMQELGPKLQKLYIRRAMQISLDSFLLVRRCVNLKRLTIANVPHLTDEVLSSILATIGHQLTFLQLEALSISNASIQVLAQSCINLVQLRVFQCHQWESLDVLLENYRLTRLKTLVIHACDQLQSFIECACPSNNGSIMLSSNHLSDSPESSSLPDVRRIRDTGYISPIDALHLMSSPTTPGSDLATSPTRKANVCQICAVIAVTHFELVSCDMLDQKCIKSLINHWTGLRRFIFVGSAGLDISIRKILLKRKNLVTSIYALTPSSPNFEN